MHYTVVFENSELTNGLFGTRFLVHYEDKKDYLRKKTESPMLSVLAEDATEYEFKNHLALTPEICRLMAAIEEAHQSNLKVTPARIFSVHIPIAIRLIELDRQWIGENNLTRPDASKYVSFFQKMVAQRHTAKLIDMLSVLTRYQPNQFGQINIW